MNTFAVIILAALVLEFALDLAGNLLNLQALKQEIPPVLQGIYKPKLYRQSQEYLRAGTRFELLSSSYTLFLTLFFWFSEGFNWLDQIVRAWRFPPLVNGLLYIGILFFAYFLLKLPFNVYDTFVIEKRFGFNRTSPRTFIADKLKGLGLVLFLGGLLLAGILALFQYLGTAAWLCCWLELVAFSLITQYVAPTWIMPLFNKFRPMESGELKDAILKYASSVKFPISNVFVMDGSRRSNKSNAFFTGFGSNKRIVLFDTLIAQHTVWEIVAVLAHEVGHYKKKHVLQAIIMNIFHMGVLFFLLSLVLDNQELYQAFYLKQVSFYTGLLLFSLLYTPIDLVLSIFTHMLSRMNEYKADRFALETIDNPDYIIEALKKLSAANLSNLTPHPFYVWLNYSHPPLGQRILAIKGLSPGRKDNLH